MGKACGLAYTALLGAAMLVLAGCPNGMGSPNSSDSLISFSFKSVTATASINGTAISVTVPYGTNVGALVADFDSSGATVKAGQVSLTSGSTPLDYSQPVSLTVMGSDGSTKTYTVTVTVAPPSTNALLASATLADSNGGTYTFSPSFSPTSYSYTQGSPTSLPSNGGAYTYTLTLIPQDQTATIVVTEAGVSGTDAKFGNDFTLKLTKPGTSATITATVTAQDGSTTQTYDFALDVLFRG